MELSHCQSCETELKGKFCHACGEKQIAESDFRIWNIVKQGTSFITNLDSRFFKSFVPLIIKPGFLTHEYVNGRRKPYMSPFQIFIISNIIFFIFLTDADILRAPARWFFNGAGMEGKMDSLAKGLSKTVNETEIIFDNNSNAYAKGLVVLLIPIVGLTLHVFNFRKSIKYGKQVILSIHLLSFFLISVVLVEFVLDFLRYIKLITGNMSVYFRIALFSVLFYFSFASLRKYYSRSIFSAALRSGLIAVFAILFIIIYRSCISWLTLYLM